MSSVYEENAECPLCHQHNAGFDLNCKTNEQELVCHRPECGYAYEQQIVQRKSSSGKDYSFWQVTEEFPLNEDGSVRRRTNAVTEELKDVENPQIAPGNFELLLGMKNAGIIWSFNRLTRVFAVHLSGCMGGSSVRLNAHTEGDKNERPFRSHIELATVTCQKIKSSMKSLGIWKTEYEKHVEHVLDDVTEQFVPPPPAQATHYQSVDDEVGDTWCGRSPKKSRMAGKGETPMRTYCAARTGPVIVV